MFSPFVLCRSSLTAFPSSAMASLSLYFLYRFHIPLYYSFATCLLLYALLFRTLSLFIDRLPSSTMASLSLYGLNPFSCSLFPLLFVLLLYLSPTVCSASSSCPSSLAAFHHPPRLPFLFMVLIFCLVVCSPFCLLFCYLSLTLFTQLFRGSQSFSIDRCL